MGHAFDIISENYLSWFPNQDRQFFPIFYSFYSTSFITLDVYVFFIHFKLVFFICCILWIQFSSVQSFSRVRLFETPWTAARKASLSITNSQSLLKLMSTELGGAIQPSHPLSSPSPPTFNLSQDQGLFKWVSSSHQGASFKISPSSEYSGLISFRMDWLDLLAVRGTLKSLLKHHSLKASILQRSAFGLQFFFAYEQLPSTIICQKGTLSLLTKLHISVENQFLIYVWICF